LHLGLKPPYQCLDQTETVFPGSGSGRPSNRGSPKSARSRRTIALDADTVTALRSHHATQLLERDFAGDAYQDGDLVFCDELGGPVHPNRLSARFGRHRKAAGIPTGTLHTLRHTAATLALTSGVPVHIVAARLGDDPNTVLSTYAHLLPQSDELAAERVAAALTASGQSCSIGRVIDSRRCCLGSS
jgi:integrase